MLVHESRQIGGGQTRDGKSEHRHSRNQQTKMDWNGWFNSDDHYIYYCVQKSLRRNGVAIMVNKRVQNAVLGCNLKNDREWSLFVFKANYSISPQSKPMPQPVTLKKLKLNGLWRPTRPFRTPRKDVLLIIEDWNAKIGSQETPGVTGKFGLGIRNEAGQREFCQENALVITKAWLLY